MADVAGWELILGGALAIWVLWRFNRRSGPGRAPHEETGDLTGDEAPPNDWLGLLLPIAVVILFIFFLIYNLRN